MQCLYEDTKLRRKAGGRRKASYIYQLWGACDGRVCAGCLISKATSAATAHGARIVILPPLSKKLALEHKSIAELSSK